MVQERTSHIYDEEKTVETPEITEVAFGDTARLTIEVFSKVGCVDLDSLEFHSVQIEPQSKMAKELECYIERQVHNWANSNLAHEVGMTKKKTQESYNGLSFNYDCFEPNLKLVSQHFHGLDTRITKCRYKATRFGT